MQDHSDYFIQQTLKNWAASQHPSDKVKAKLLLSAAAHNTSNILLGYEIVGQTSINQHRYNISGISNLFPAEQIVEPIHQTRLWLLQITPPLLRYMA